MTERDELWKILEGLLVLGAVMILTTARALRRRASDPRSARSS